MEENETPDTATETAQIVLPIMDIVMVDGIMGTDISTAVNVGVMVELPASAIEIK